MVMETEFALALDAAKFRSTNSAWNSLMLNDPWSVGYVTTLIELKPFSEKEEWEAFYYRSGEEREVIISRWDADTQRTLQDSLLIKEDRNAVSSLSWNLRSLNTQFGRTRERLHKKGEILYNHLKGNGYGLTLDDCVECVRFRVIGETWNGVVLRERNTIKTLQGLYPQVDFRRVPGELDHSYAVDYEAYMGGQLRYALQVKPKSYTGNATYLLNARQANSRKNQLYKARFGAPVYNIIADHKGNILNSEVLLNL